MSYQRFEPIDPRVVVGHVHLKVSDLERLRDDATTVKGWFKNPATRILLVFFFSNLGSAVGTWVAGFQIFDALS